MADESKQAGAKVWDIPKESELRFEVADGHTANVMLLSGTAEVFGAELAEMKEYSFPAGSKVPIYSWYGAKLKMSDPTAVGNTAYLSSDTPMSTYANIHQRLEARRADAAKAGSHGPRVMVVGPTDAGKSSLCRILLSYAVRAGRTPVYVDLDVGQGDLSVPGTICATTLTTTSLDPQTGFVLTTPLVYSVGASSPRHNMDLYKRLVERLASTVNRRMEDPAARASGMVINTCGWVTDDGYDLIVHNARALAVDVVLVLGQDRLHALLNRDLKHVTLPAIGAGASGSAGAAGAGGAGSGSGSGSGSGGGAKEVEKEVDVVKLAATGGVVPRSSTVRREARKQRIREYFYGRDRSLSPSLTTVSFDDVKLWRIGGNQLDDAMVRPVGAESALDPVRVEEVLPDRRLEHAVLAVSCSQSKDEVNETNVAGFVVVHSVDPDARTMALLAPCPGPLPSKHLIVGKITFVEG